MRELERQESVAVAVIDSVAAAVEGPDGVADDGGALGLLHGGLRGLLVGLVGVEGAVVDGLCDALSLAQGQSHTSYD